MQTYIIIIILFFYFFKYPIIIIIIIIIIVIISLNPSRHRLHLFRRTAFTDTGLLNGFLFSFFR